MYSTLSSPAFRLGLSRILCKSGRSTGSLVLPLSSQIHSSIIQPQSPSLIGSDYVVRSPFAEIEPPTKDLYSLVADNFPKHGSKIALVDGISGREYSYNEFNEAVCKFSSGLRRLDFVKGDVLGIVAPNSPEWAVVYLGALASGGVVTTCNPAFTAEELAFQFKNSGAKIVATVSPMLPTVQEAASKSGISKIIVIDNVDPQNSTGNLVSYNSLATDSGSRFSPVQTAPDDVTLLPYSSGTTGFPKGVMLTNRSVGSNILQKIDKDLFDLSVGDNRLIGVLPFFHVYGTVVVLLPSLYAGSKVVTLPNFQPESFLSTIEKHKINIAHMVPPLVVFLAKHPLVEKYDVTSITDLLTAAAPIGGEIAKAASMRTNCKLIRQGYGLTETSAITHLMPKSLGMELPDSVGHCVRSVRVKIVDPESGKALPPNEEGEVWIGGPTLMKGYLNNPVATKECLTDDGWFKSGDVGYYNERGLFYITDRLKELIKVKGLQVAPAELEALLLTHPKIADAAVIGVQNEWLGEAPKAFVVKKDDGLSEKEVEEFVAGKISKHKHLAGGVTFIETVPKSPSGKILRRVLRSAEK